MPKMSKEQCDHCKTRCFRRLTRYSWWNGIAQVTKYFCENCVRDIAPPAKLVRQMGGTVSEEVEDVRTTHNKTV
jgi:hypothetical protein